MAKLNNIEIAETPLARKALEHAERDISQYGIDRNEQLKQLSRTEAKMIHYEALIAFWKERIEGLAK